MDTRRLILWGVFIASLLFLWTSWQREHAPALPSPASALDQRTAGVQQGSGAVPTAGSQGAAAVNGLPSVAEASAATPAEQIAVRTDLFAIQISTRGAGIERLELLKHRYKPDPTRSILLDLFSAKDETDPASNVVLLDKTAQRTFVAESGLVGGAGMPNHNATFRQIPGPTTLADGENELNVSFETTSGGIHLVKTYHFKRDSYDIRVTHQISNVGEQTLSPELYLELVRDSHQTSEKRPFYSPYFGPAVYRDQDKFQEVSFDDITKGRDKAKPREASDGWIAMLQHYFVAAWIPSAGGARTYLTEKVDADTFRVVARMPLETLAPKATVTNEAQLFVGPEEQHILENVAPGFDLVRDYGWTKILLAPAVFWMLEHLHGWIGNWGWAIVALTVLIKLAFYPLSAASYKSMARMKNVAPRLKALQERYKDDRAQLNKAMMELYRTEKINPMGGCLPILIQIPVFISLYSVLSASVEMRGAPWLGWIHDLAAPDPFSILPLIMMASMFVQYKLNPAPPDPVQARMMMIMPLVFGVTFFFFPAGLVLYWVVNNLLAIAQQWQITRMIGSKVKN